MKYIRDFSKAPRYRPTATSDISGVFYLQVFSHFEGGLKNTIPTSIIGLPDYVRMVKDDRYFEEFNIIRSLRASSNDEYKILKRELPYITPSVLLNKRNLKTSSEVQENLIQFTGYFYFDIDTFPEQYSVYTYKDYIIKRYGHLVSFVCLSSSLGGVSILIKINNEVTIDNFQSLWDTIRLTILKDEEIDTNCQGIGRAMIQSYDKELYVNYDNCITLDSVIDNKEKIGIDPIVCTVYNKANPHLFNQCNKLDPSTFKYKVYNIDEVLATIKTKTIIPVFNPVVEFREEDVIETYIPKVIIDGMKHKTYYVLIHQLCYLNQDVPLDYLYSMLFYVNNIYAKPRMEVKELSRFFTFIISKIIKTGKINVRPKKRWVHWNKENKELTSQEKLKIAKVLTGAFERHTTINKIQEAKKQLELEGKKITNRAIAKMIQMDVSTVGKRIKDKPVDMDYEVSLWN